MTDSIILPEISVQAGLFPDDPVHDVASMRLGNATSGKLGTGTLGTSVAWADISDDVISFSVNRPSTRQQGPLWTFQPGTISITLDNSDGTYDPDNAASIYAGQLIPMVPVRVLATFGGVTYPIYSGFADGWFPATVTTNTDYTELTLSATDAFKVLGNINLPAVTITGVGATTGARVRDILTRAGWYDSAERLSIDNGNSTLQGTTLDGDALSLMHVAVDSELGQLFVNGAGAVKFNERRGLLTDTNSNTVQGVFGDSPGTSHTAGTELPCAGIARTIDDTTIVNDVQVTRVGGTLQEVQDVASQNTYLFIRSYSRSDIILQTDSEALSWAQWVLYIGKSSENRFESVTIDALADPVNLFPHLLGREIGDRIQLWRRPPNVATPLSKDCFIVGISHDWDSMNVRWVTTWTLQDAQKYGSFLTLGNSTLGKLGSNALVF